jgi:hypothetical protein
VFTLPHALLEPIAFGAARGIVVPSITELAVPPPTYVLVVPVVGLPEAILSPFALYTITCDRPKLPSLSLAVKFREPAVYVFDLSSCAVLAVAS